MKDPKLIASFAQSLKAYRKQQGMSQEQLATKSGLDDTFISMLERGLRQPTLSTFFQLADALEVSPVEFISAIRKESNV